VKIRRQCRPRDSCRKLGTAAGIGNRVDDVALEDAASVQEASPAGSFVFLLASEKIEKPHLSIASTFAGAIGGGDERGGLNNL
jgi:hypothetical protein